MALTNGRDLCLVSVSKETKHEKSSKKNSSRFRSTAVFTVGRGGRWILERLPVCGLLHMHWKPEDPIATDPDAQDSDKRNKMQIWHVTEMVPTFWAEFPQPEKHFPNLLVKKTWPPKTGERHRGVQNLRALLGGVQNIILGDTLMGCFGGEFAVRFAPRGSRPWSQTMVSERARPWSRGRSGDCEIFFSRPELDGKASDIGVGGRSGSLLSGLPRPQTRARIPISWKRGFRGPKTPLEKGVFSQKKTLFYAREHMENGDFWTENSLFRPF